ncbi:MAG: GNAT family N-acetyltransferase [Gammaproteobacteria bacterium]
MKTKNRKPTFTVREAAEKDIPVLVDFLIEIGLHVSGAPRQTLSQQADERLRKFLRGYIHDNEKHIVVACTSRGRVVGMGNIQIWHSPNLWEEAEELDLKSAFIDDLWVEPDFREQGIMTLILDELIRFAEYHGIQELFLEYSLSNKEAAAVWERLGFNPTGVRAAAWTRNVREKLSGVGS